ncbi:hypothetical protein ACJ5NV_18760 [Loktanella agnita]|uniref:hypothetical protein n=1 Tax=Loktanella agnita TaxID=287097 RepID=UPI003989FEDD
MKRHGRLPNLLQPGTFTEKQLLFKFFAPIPIVSTSDKLGSRKYASHYLTEKVRIPRVVWASTTADIPKPGEVASGRYWFKSNHSSGTNMPVTLPLVHAQQELMKARANKWFERIHSRRLALWWYEIFPKQVYLEEDLSDGDGFSADDWKFFVSNGKVVIFQHDKDRHQNHIQTIFDRRGNHLNMELYYRVLCYPTFCH